jgi:PPOX class probable F420-dependent enzyme
MAHAVEGRAGELIEGRNFANVATIGEDGTPHAALAWIARDGDNVLLNSAEGRAWPGNLARDPRVTITVPNAENPYEYVSIKGRATEITRDGADEHIDELSKKYLGQDEYPFRTPDEVRIRIRVEPESVRVWGG